MDLTAVSLLAEALERIIWRLPCPTLESGDPAIRCLLEAAGCRIPAVLAELSDEALAVAVQKNFLRKHAFEELLVHRQERRLLAWFFRRTSSWELGQDLTQELYLKLLANNYLAQYNPDYPFEPWLYRIVHNLWISDWRRRRRHVAAAAVELVDSCTPVEEAALRELQERLDRAVRELPDLQQRVFREALTGGNAAQLARELQVPKERVFQLLFKARRRIEHALAEHPALSGHAARPSHPPL